jgi:hypothetical protein
VTLFYTPLLTPEMAHALPCRPPLQCVQMRSAPPSERAYTLVGPRSIGEYRCGWMKGRQDSVSPESSRMLSVFSTPKHMDQRRSEYQRPRLSRRAVTCPVAIDMMNGLSVDRQHPADRTSLTHKSASRSILYVPLHLSA